MSQYINRFFFAATAVAALASIVLTQTTARAESITFTFSGTASGTLNGESFTNANYLIALTTDTTLITQSGNFFATPAVSGTTINISGFGLATFTRAKRVFNSTGGSVIGFQEFQGNNRNDLIDINDSSLATYDLRSAFGPLTNTNFNQTQFRFVDTSLGELTFNDGSFDTATFQAISAVTVPEGNTFALALPALGMVALCNRVGAVPIKRRKK